MPGTVPKINPDIAKERKTATFDVEEFAAWWHGGADKLRTKREIVSEMIDDPELNEGVPIYYFSFQDQYDEATKKGTILARKLKEIQAKRNPGGNDIYPTMLNSLGSGFVPVGTTLLLHYAMFVPAIEKQGTPEQIAKWYPRAANAKILGTYAQTELGHGTFIRGLETRADYDAKTQEFVLNSPTITAYKWWPGGLGHSANHAVVVAQLYINDKNNGVQMFMIQLRDEETHMPLPGIHIGEIGNKLGFQGVNNGFLGFKNFRIPRTNMLMKNAQVHPDGTFVSSPSVLTYGTMVYVRVLVAIEAMQFLSVGTTIATRYSAVRRQSVINPTEPEVQIMDHVTQQLKIFPEIAKTIVLKLASDFALQLYNEVNKEINEGNLNRLAEIHALSTCLKSLSTTEASNGIETLRLACGGHGYMLSSNMPGLYAFATAAVTYDGENTVMLLQTSRFLMKAWSMAVKGVSLPPTVSYLGESLKTIRFPKWDGSLECMVKALQFASANKIRVAFNHLQERKKQGKTPEEAANATSIEMLQAADLHGRSFLAFLAWQKLTVETGNRSPQLNAVLRDVAELYIINACLRNMKDILRFIHLTEEDLTGLQSALEHTLTRIRPNAVAIVDGFDFHDKMLNSTLGSYDGNAYERIFAAAQQSPMNKIPVQKSFHQYLKPFMRSNM